MSVRRRRTYRVDSSRSEMKDSNAEAVETGEACRSLRSFVGVVRGGETEVRVERVGAVPGPIDVSFVAVVLWPLAREGEILGTLSVELEMSAARLVSVVGS